MRTHHKACIISLVTCLAWIPNVWAEASSVSCWLQKYQAYAEAQKKWQQDSTRLVIALTPQFSEVASRYRDEQLQRIQRRETAVRLLLQTEPSKVNTDKPLYAWLNLDNTLIAQMAAEHEVFSKLQKTIEHQENRAPHPDGDSLRSVMRTKVMESPEFQKLLAEFQATVSRIEQTPCDGG